MVPGRCSRPFLRPQTASCAPSPSPAHDKPGTSEYRLSHHQVSPLSEPPQQLSPLHFTLTIACAHSQEDGRTQRVQSAGWRISGVGSYLNLHPYPHARAHTWVLVSCMRPIVPSIILVAHITWPTNTDHCVHALAVWLGHHG